MLNQKRKILCSLGIALSILAAQIFPIANSVSANATIGGSFITGEESASYTIDSDLLDDINEKGYVVDAFDNNKKTQDLWVRSDEFTNPVTAPSGFTVNQSIENGALKVQNTLSSGSYNTAALNNQLAYSYELRSSYNLKNIDYISADLEFSPSGSSFIIWLGKNETGISGVRLFNEGKTLVAKSIVLNIKTGEVKEYNARQNVRVNSENYKWHFEVAYELFYESGTYKYYLVLSNENGESGTPHYLYGSNSTNASKCDLTELGFAFSVATNSKVNAFVKLDNLKLYFDDDYDYAEEFIGDHKKAMGLQAATVSVVDEATIDSFLTEYETLPAREKFWFAQVYKRVKGLKDNIVSLKSEGKTDEEIKRPQDDYSKWSLDFDSEQDIRLFTAYRNYNQLTGDISTDDANPVYGTLSIKRDDELNKNCLSIVGAGRNWTSSAIYGPKSITLPKNAYANHISFKLKAVEQVYTDTRFLIYLTYKDDENFDAITSKIDKGYWNCQLESRVDNVLKRTTLFTAESDLDLYEWTEFDITNTPGAKPTTTLIVNQYGTDDTYTATFARRNDKNMPSFSASWLAKGEIYIADLSLTLEKGADEIIDIAPEEPIVYYTGNTTYKSGETVLVSGDNLYSTVSKVLLADATNVYNPSDAKYMFETNYDKSSKREKATYFEIANNFSSLIFNEVKIEQWTEDSFKFIIPESYEENGVYALKIIGKNDKEYVYYINNPDIDYAVGNEGEFATAGGTLQIVGKSFSPSFKKDGGEKVAAIIRNTTDPSKQVVLTAKDGEIKVDSDYSVILSIPKTLENGKYEVSLYNGYGDSNAWSEPFSFEVISPIRDSWGKEAKGDVYTVDISTLGATGYQQQNATPYFVEALEMLAQNGGGVLYLPKGWYQLQFSIVIPENVRVVGEGRDNTIVYFLPSYWLYGELPDYSIAFKGNVSFEGITFYATRLAALFNQYGDNPENVYINDVYYYQSVFQGSATNAGGSNSGNIINGYTSAEIRLMLQDEYNKTATLPFDITNTVTNFQLDGFDYKVTAYGGGNVLNMRYGIHRNSNHEPTDVWSRIQGSRMVYDNVNFNETCISLNGQGVYYTHCSFKNKTSNNHELLVADEGHIWSNKNSGQSGKIKKINETTYELVDYQYNEGAITGNMLFITAGQGLGQIRMITANAGSRIVIDNPFEIEPNLNSSIMIGQPRKDHVFNDNLFYRGTCGGYYGNVGGTIYDSNTYKQVANIYYYARNGCPVWYVTVKDNDYSEPVHLHYAGDDLASSGTCEIQFRSEGIINGFLAGVFKNNHLDGYKFKSYGIVQKGQTDYVIEGNFFENEDTGVVFQTNKGVYNGIFCYNNIFQNVEQAYQNYDNFKALGFNKQASRIIIVKGYSGTARLKRGDVNLDGIVSLKDVTLIRFYLIDMAELSEAQKTNADVYTDGKVTAKDATIIRNYLLGLIDFDDVEVESSAPPSS
ncbi:MAG: hypothetical protein IJP22_01750, partial [Clostridia bacterium]|nr:hypothetical protein [Clostridia bacterium]